MFLFLKLKESLNFFFVLLNIVTFFFCLYFYFNIKKMKQRISDLELETKEILERKIFKVLEDDLISIQHLSKEDSEVELVSENDKKEVLVSEKANISLKNTDMVSAQYMAKKIDKDAIPKNLNSVSSLMDVSLSQEEDMVVDDLTTEIDLLDFKLDEFVKKKEAIVLTVHPENRHDKLLQDISDQMIEYLKPKTIELTDYEKDQEEHAIISYQELLSFQNKFEILDDKEELPSIEELKYFRN